VPTEPLTFIRAYSARPDQIQFVRADLRRLLASFPVADDAILSASELAANAALHSHSRMPGGTFTVRARLSPGNYVSIEVEDSGGPWIGTTDDAAQGHGLVIVRSLASASGIGGDHDGRTAWVRFDWPPA
jgi:anti-sigma regulatory factor (Ser/Thr protein kinase)